MSVQPIGNKLDRASLISSIEQQANIDALQNKLMSLPEQMRAKQQELQDARERLEVIKGDLQLEESLLMVEITEAQNPATGKPLYSNDTSRKAELAKRQANSKSYQTILATYKEAESAVYSAQFDYDMLSHQFGAAISILNARASWLGFRASLGA